MQFLRMAGPGVTVPPRSRSESGNTVKGKHNILDGFLGVAGLV